MIELRGPDSGRLYGRYLRQRGVIEFRRGDRIEYVDVTQLGLIAAFDSPRCDQRQGQGPTADGNAPMQA